MLELVNSKYIPNVEADSRFYWMSQVIMSSGGQHLKRMERDILGSAQVTAARDVKSVWVLSTSEQANILTLGADLRADYPDHAMIKVAGLSLMAMRKAGVDIEDITLEGGRLVSGAQMAADVAVNPEATRHDHNYALVPRLESMFDDLQTRMVRYGSPTSY